MHAKQTHNLVLGGLFLALGLVLPFLTGQIQQIGNMLLPMHLPVFLCGLICGWRYGLCVGAAMPIFRSLLFGMPVLYPNAVAMAFELAAYGFTAGLLFMSARKKNLFTLYRALIPAMLAGRVVWGCVQTVLLGLSDKPFGWTAFLAGAFLNAIPGIILQLVLIPSIMLILDRTHLVPFDDSAQ